MGFLASHASSTAPLCPLACVQCGHPKPRNIPALSHCLLPMHAESFRASLRPQEDKRRSAFCPLCRSESGDFSRVSEEQGTKWRSRGGEQRVPGRSRCAIIYSNAYSCLLRTHSSLDGSRRSEEDAGPDRGVLTDGNVYLRWS